MKLSFIKTVCFSLTSEWNRLCRSLFCNGWSHFLFFFRLIWKWSVNLPFTSSLPKCLWQEKLESLTARHLHARYPRTELSHHVLPPRVWIRRKLGMYNVASDFSVANSLLKSKMMLEQVFDSAPKCPLHTPALHAMLECLCLGPSSSASGLESC